MTPSKHGLTLTKRDLAMFQLLAKYGVLATSHLEQRVFPGVQNSTVLRRFRRLEKLGWIYRVKAALNNGEGVWLLTRKGEALLKVKSPMPRPNRNGLAHDVLLGTVRMRLESIGLGENYVPDWSIKQQTFKPRQSRREDSQIVPDGLFSATLWNKNRATIALELELHAKTTQRYKKIFIKYMDKKNLHVVWYFVKTEAFADALITKWNHVKSRRYRHEGTSTELFVTVLAEFEANPRDALIRRPSCEEHSVEEYFQTSQPQTTAAQGVGRESDPTHEADDSEMAS